MVAVTALSLLEGCQAFANEVHERTCWKGEGGREKNDFCRDDMKDMEGGSPEHKPDILLGYGLIFE